MFPYYYKYLSRFSPNAYFTPLLLVAVFCTAYMALFPKNYSLVFIEDADRWRS